VILKVEGEVIDPVAIEPQYVTFGRLTTDCMAGEGLSQKVTVTNNMDTPAELGEIHSSSPARNLNC
jgi:hypothetical protein